MSDFLISGYQETYKSFQENLKKVRRKPSRANVHDLRVDIKKLRAYQNLISEISSSSDLPRAFHVKRLFRTAGQVREAQVNHKLVDSKSKKYLNTYRKYLKRIERNAKQKLKHEVDQFDRGHWQSLKKQLNKAVNLNQRKTEKRITQFLGNTLITITNLAQNSDDHSLHEIRKHLRIVNEVLKLLDSESMSFNHRKIIKQLGPFQDQIGDWHDQVVLVQSMIHFNECQQPRQRSSNFQKYLRKKQRSTDSTRIEILNTMASGLPGIIKKCNLRC